MSRPLQRHLSDASRARVRPPLAVGVMTVLLALQAAAAMAQPVAPQPAQATTMAAYASGDGWIDAHLADIDAYAARHPEAFLAEIERYAGVSRDYARSLLQHPRWRAGDVWFACFLGHALEQGCRDVVRARTRAGREAAWSAVVAGMAAEGDAFARLRLALADSYRRWARPLHPEAAPARAPR